MKALYPRNIHDIIHVYILLCAAPDDDTDDDDAAFDDDGPARRLHSVDITGLPLAPLLPPPFPSSHIHTHASSTGYAMLDPGPTCGHNLMWPTAVPPPPSLSPPSIPPSLPSQVTSLWLSSGCPQNRSTQPYTLDPTCRTRTHTRTHAHTHARTHARTHTHTHASTRGHAMLDPFPQSASKTADQNPPPLMRGRGRRLHGLTRSGQNLLGRPARLAWCIDIWFIHDLERYRDEHRGSVRDTDNTHIGI
jgi:hypothetical protein